MGNYLCPSPPPPTLTGIYVALGVLLVFSILVIFAVSWLAWEMRNQRKILEKLERTRTAAEDSDECQPGVKRDESNVGAIPAIPSLSGWAFPATRRCSSVRTVLSSAGRMSNSDCPGVRPRGRFTRARARSLTRQKPLTRSCSVKTKGFWAPSSQYKLQQRSENERVAAREASAKLELEMEELKRRGDEMLEVNNRLREEITEVKRGLDDLCANVEIPMEQLMHTELTINKIATLLETLLVNSHQKAHEVTNVKRGLDDLCAKVEIPMEQLTRIELLIYKMAYDSSQKAHEVTDVKRGLDDLCAKVEIPMEQLMHTELTINKIATLLEKMADNSLQEAQDKAVKKNTAKRVNRSGRKNSRTKV